MQDPLGIYKTTSVEQAPNPIQGDLSGIAPVMNMLAILQGKPITLDFKTSQEDALQKNKIQKAYIKHKVIVFLILKKIQKESTLVYYVQVKATLEHIQLHLREVSNALSN